MTFVPSDHEQAPKVEATPARQGFRGMHVFIVLVISTVLAAAALFSAWAWRSHDLNNAEATKTPVAAANANSAGDPAVTPATSTPAHP
jgi:hypothetical protein